MPSGRVDARRGATRRESWKEWTKVSQGPRMQNSNTHLADKRYMIYLAADDQHKREKLREKLSDLRSGQYREPWRGMKQQKILWVSSKTGQNGRAIVIEGICSRDLKQKIMDGIMESGVEVTGVLCQWGQNVGTLYSAEKNGLSSEELLERTFRGGKQQQYGLEQKTIQDISKYIDRGWNDHYIEHHHQDMFTGGETAEAKQQDRQFMARIEKGKRNRGESLDRQTRLKLEEKRRRIEREANKRAREENSESESESEDSELEEMEDMLRRNGGYNEEDIRKATEGLRRQKTERQRKRNSRTVSSWQGSRRGNGTEGRAWTDRRD